MKKAVIVIDMPKCCKDCFRYQADAWFGGSCTQAKEEDGWNKHIDADDEYSVQNWCPLRPLPEKWEIQPYNSRSRVDWKKKMRLIDADKLENDIVENITVKAVSRMLAITQGQPTVKAIPIEWIKDKMDELEGTGRFELSEYLDELLADWEKENGRSE